jgi:cytochrome c oxidase subunit 3
MEIPYTTAARPDTGLWNAKIGIWLFLASEVMLFGGLFSAYIFLRLDALPGYWPRGLLNVPVGTMNTAILIASSVTVVLAWAALKMRQFAKYKFYMAITIICGIIFLAVKLAYEWPDKFHHFGAYIRQDRLEKYEQYLGNAHLLDKGLERRVEITGHLENPEALTDPNIKEYHVQLDAVNADPTNPQSDRPHFWPLAEERQDRAHREGGCRPRGDVRAEAQHLLRHLLHDHRAARPPRARRRDRLHYFWLPVGANLYKRNPEQLANRVEVAGLFWHFVDLVWIFVFPLFYLL